MSEAFWSFWSWCLIGGTSFLTVFPGFKSASPNEHGRYWRPLGAGAKATILRRATFALSGRNWLFAWPWLLPPVVIAAIFLGVNFGEHNYASAWEYVSRIAGTVLGLGVAAGLTYPFVLRKALAGYRLKVALVGAKMLARIGDPQQATALLVQSAQHPDAHIRQAAASGLRELDNAESRAALQALSDDPNPHVEQAARDALTQLAKLLQGHRPHSLRQMDTLTINHRILEQKRQPNQSITTNVDYEDYFQKTVTAIEAIVYSQVQQRNAFPHVYCEDCLARAEVQRYDEWEWVRCAKCKDAVSLLPNIVVVTGHIGGATNWAIDNGHLRIGLWDATAHQARNAEIARLEIIGGNAIDYDWAVSAVVEKLHNENPAYGQGIAVVLVGAPQLSPNSLQLLRALDPMFVTP